MNFEVTKLLLTYSSRSNVLWWSPSYPRIRKIYEYYVENHNRTLNVKGSLPLYHNPYVFTLLHAGDGSHSLTQLLISCSLRVSMSLRNLGSPRVDRVHLRFISPTSPWGEPSTCLYYDTCFRRRFPM